jgi:hypothetical protein
LPPHARVALSDRRIEQSLPELLRHPRPDELVRSRDERGVRLHADARKLLKEQKPDLIAVAFDLIGPTFRHKQFDDYKKDRKPMPDDLSVQVPLIYEVISGLNIPIISREEYEADDLIGSLACSARDRGYRVVIVRNLGSELVALT